MTKVKKSSEKKVIMFSILSILVLLGGLFLWEKFFDKSYLPPENNYSQSTTNQIATNKINLPPLNIDDPLDYFGSQVTAPAGYYATSGSMLEAYDSQGGMAPPRLILMKNHQVLGSENYYFEVTTETKNDCIAIWTTKGISSIDEWNSNITRFKGAYEDKAEIDVGSRKAEMYTVSSAKRSNFIAFLKVNNLDDGTSYFFHTCNTHNKTDFVDVIRSLKLRADINQHK